MPRKGLRSTPTGTTTEWTRKEPRYSNRNTDTGGEGFWRQCTSMDQQLGLWTDAGWHLDPLPGTIAHPLTLTDYALCNVIITSKVILLNTETVLFKPCSATNIIMYVSDY